MRLVADVPDSIVLVDPEGRIAGQNPAHEIRFGWSDEELIGGTLDDYLGAETAQVVWDHVHAEGWYRGRVLAQTREGERSELELSAATFRDEGGAYAGTILTMRPAAGPKGQAERLLEAVVDATAGTVGEEFLRDLVSALAEVLEVRVAFLAEIIDRAAGRVRIVEMYDDGRFLEPFEYDVADTPCEGVMAGRLCHYPRDVHLAFPRDTWLTEHSIRSYMAIRLEASSGHVLGHLGIMDDREMRHDMLKVSLLHLFAVRVAAELERVRGERELAAQARRLAASNAELETFAAVVSHDLKAPLRQIAGFLSLLTERHSEGLDEHALKLVGFASDGALRMTELLEDLLAYARLGANLPAPKPVALDGVMQDATADVASEIEEADATLDIDAAVAQLPPLLGQRSLLVELFGNLLGNAVKYRGDAPPKVRVSVERTDPDWAEVLVIDNGIGIEPRHRGAVFQIFRRLHTRTEFGGGTGIGLALCDKVARSHGGEITVDSEGPGKGSTFRVRLPLAPE